MNALSTFSKVIITILLAVAFAWFSIMTIASFSNLNHGNIGDVVLMVLCGVSARAVLYTMGDVIGVRHN